MLLCAAGSSAGALDGDKSNLAGKFNISFH